MDGNALGERLTKKVGPFPLFVWVGAVFIIAFLFIRVRNNKKGASGAGGGTGAGNQFTSSQSTSETDPKTGKTTTSQYSATGNGYLPGSLTYQAGAMPYSQGDVYVNYPVQGSPTQPAARDSNSANFLGRTHGFWYTTNRTMYPQEVAQQAYNTPDYEGAPDFVSLAYDAIGIMLANPGLKIDNNNLIPAGTKIFIPGNPGDPKGGSTWDDLTAEDKAPYVPLPVVPVPEATSLTQPVSKV
jgi:hypothetical protein